MTAQHLFAVLFNAGIAVSIGATVASLGLSFTVGQLVTPLRRVWLVTAVIVLNAVLLPAAAWGIAKVSPMDSQYVPGLVLATIGMGSAGALKAAQLAKRADLALAVSLVVVLQLVDIVAVPLWAGHVVSGASISGWDIVKDLLLLVLAPLAVGLALKARYPDEAPGWQPGIVRASNLALVIALTTGIAANWATIVTMIGSWVIVTSIVIVLVSLVAGALVGGKNPETRNTTTLVSGMRFASLGLIIIGTQLGGAANYIGPAITFALVDLILPMLLAVEIGRRHARRQVAK
jgi:predicted Na+-dependent transporter